MEIQRTHDQLYLNENYKENPKEYFKVLAKMIENEWAGRLTNCRILDVGCETGSFLHYIESLQWGAGLYGMDIMPELLQALNNDKEIHATTYLGNIADKSTLPDIKVDIVTMLGVISIFDDYKPVIINLLDLLEDNGVIYIFGIFNPEDLDVIIKSRASNSNDDKWEVGWNLFSKKSIGLFCQKHGLECDFVPFKIGIDIAKHEGDPLRSWTVPMPDGDRMVVNGLQLIHNFYFLRIQRKNK